MSCDKFKKKQSREVRIGTTYVRNFTSFFICKTKSYQKVAAKGFVPVLKISVKVSARSFLRAVIDF